MEEHTLPAADAPVEDAAWKELDAGPLVLVAGVGGPLIVAVCSIPAERSENVIATER